MNLVKVYRINCIQDAPYMRANLAAKRTGLRRGAARLLARVPGGHIYLGRDRLSARHGGAQHHRTSAQGSRVHHGQWISSGASPSRDTSLLRIGPPGRQAWYTYFAAGSIGIRNVPLRSLTAKYELSTAST